MGNDEERERVRVLVNIRTGGMLLSVIGWIQRKASWDWSSERDPTEIVEARGARGRGAEDARMRQGSGDWWATTAGTRLPRSFLVVRDVGSGIF